MGEHLPLWIYTLFAYYSQTADFDIWAPQITSARDLHKHKFFTWNVEFTLQPKKYDLKKKKYVEGLKCPIKK